MPVRRNGQLAETCLSYSREGCIAMVSSFTADSFYQKSIYPEIRPIHNVVDIPKVSA